MNTDPNKNNVGFSNGDNGASIRKKARLNKLIELALRYGIFNESRLIELAVQTFHCDQRSARTYTSIVLERLRAGQATLEKSR